MGTLTLDEHGMICDCNQDCETLFNYPRSDLVSRHVSTLLPQLAEWDLVQDGQINPRLRFLCRTGRHFQAMTHDGGNFASELFFTRLDGTGSHRVLMIVLQAKEGAGEGKRRASGGLNARE